MEENKDTFVDYMYASDLQDILNNTDAKFVSEEVKKMFLALKEKGDVLLKTKYTVDSPVTYIKIEDAENVLLI